MESKRAKTVAKSVKTKPPAKRPATEQPTKSVKTKPSTKRPAAEQPTKRPAAEPLGNLSNNIGGRPKRITKKPKEDLALGGSRRGDLGRIGGRGLRGKGLREAEEDDNGGDGTTGIEPSIFFVDPLTIGIEITYHLPYIEYRSNYLIKF